MAKREPAIVEINFPVNIGGVEVSKFRMRSPRVKDSYEWRGIFNSQDPERMVETQLRLCGHLCDLSQAEFQELQLVDGLKFLKILGEWMQPREEKPEAALPPAIVGLDVPVNIQGVEVSELRMRSPQVKDAYQYRGVFNPQDQEKMVVTQLRLCAHLCDVSQAEFKELDLADGLKFVAIFGEWMESPEGKAAASLVQGS